MYRDKGRHTHTHTHIGVSGGQYVLFIDEFGINANSTEIKYTVVGVTRVCECVCVCVCACTHKLLATLRLTLYHNIQNKAVGDD